MGIANEVQFEYNNKALLYCVCYFVKFISEYVNMYYLIAY